MKRDLFVYLIICLFSAIQIRSQELVNICPSFIPDDIYGLDGMFKNEYEGWIIGIGELPQRLYRTTDSGKTWDIQMSRDSIFYSDLCFVNDNYGWMKVSKWIGPNSNYEYYLYRTNDGGITWNQASSPPDFAFYAITFVDSLNGYSGGRNEIFMTIDGGKTWSEQYIDREVEEILSGDTVRYDASFSIEDLIFVDKQYGWAVGNRNDITDCGIILNTINSGRSWQIQLPETLIMKAVFFLNNLHGFAVGANVWWEGVIMVTNDGGENWQDMYLPCSWLNDVIFTDDSTGWIVGDYGFIWYTEDSGQTWTQVESGTDTDLNRVVFVYNGNVGYIFGESNTLLKYDKNGNYIENKSLSPVQFTLYQNYPNPFNTQTVIVYNMEITGDVILKIYDLNGKEVITLLNKQIYPGSHQVVWNGKDNRGNKMSSGIYFYELRTGKLRRVCKMILMH